MPGVARWWARRLPERVEVFPRWSAYTTLQEDPDMPDYLCVSCVTTFSRLDDIGLEVTGQRPKPDRAVLPCRAVETHPGDRWCRRCGREGTVRDTAWCGDTRELLEVVTTHLRALEEQVKRHEDTINDLQWGAVRILISDTPEAVTGPAGQRAVRAVQLSTEDLAQDIQRSTATAGATHQLLTAAGQELVPKPSVHGPGRHAPGGFMRNPLACRWPPRSS